MALLTADARLTMPPYPLEYAGPRGDPRLPVDRSGRRRPDQVTLVATRANGQPAFGCYVDGRPYGIMVLTLRGERVAAITGFTDATSSPAFALT